MSANTMRLHLQIWRQPGPDQQGKMVSYELDDVDPDMSFLEMLDVLNERLILKGEEPVVFEHDCREGICGACGMVINGIAHGPLASTTTCQLHMRHFKDGDTIAIEPWRAKAFPVIRDLMVDRSAFDRVISAGGYISTKCGSAPEANSILIGKNDAERAMDSAACIGCGACVAACKNASAMLFVSAKVTQLSSLPQGQVERFHRVKSMVAAMDEEGFGNCTNEAECEAVCPKDISMSNIVNMNREFIRAKSFH